MKPAEKGVSPVPVSHTEGEVISLLVHFSEEGVALLHLCHCEGCVASVYILISLQMEKAGDGQDVYETMTSILKRVLWNLRRNAMEKQDTLQ